MRWGPWGALVVLMAGLCGTHVDARTDAQRCVPRTLPANLEMSSDLEQIVTGFYDKSATLRAQCVRIAEAVNLDVSVQLDGSMRSSCRAFTVVQRRRGTLRAHVHVPLSRRQLAELIGHEFEHILEQLEGLDLRLLSDVRSSGVHQVDMDLFETDRAQRVGRIVAREVR
jgi:hypothetical protein